ncbi:MAG TPA: hypothetical protein DCE78_06305 [Bacteroidetes bacterium]|nr:hypothetical protein [Bacteroidota bacterium]
MTISIVGTIAGAAAGYAYYYYIGCITGTCPIQTNPWLSTLFGAIIGFLIFSEVSKYLSGGKGSTDFTSVNVESFKEHMNGDVIIMDVRSEGEYNGGHIPGAILVDVTKGDFREKISGLDKNKPVLVYCRSGNRSVTASKILSKEGFGTVLNLRRGMLEWDGEIAK